MTTEPRPNGPTVAFDAVLLVSFGGPEGLGDVVPFLENVTAGRGIPPERLVEVGAHYTKFGGVSPLNAHNRAFRAAVEADLAAYGRPLPVYWGNRNWTPYLPEALRRMRDDGIRRAAVFVTSAFSSYSGCRQYRENLADAVAEVAAQGPVEKPAEKRGVPELDLLRRYFDHPDFIEPTVDAVLAALQRLAAIAPSSPMTSAGPRRPRPPRLVFTTHSIPLSSAAASGGADRPAEGAYVAQHRAVLELVTAAVAERTGQAYQADLVFQSRSGPPQVPWLEPDISDHLAVVHAAGEVGAVIVPIGFTSDHMEVVWDLDTVALADAESLGLPCVRAATVGLDPRFVAIVRHLVAELESGAPHLSLSALGPAPDRCVAHCCPNPRGSRPAVGGSDD